MQDPSSPLRLPSSPWSLEPDSSSVPASSTPSSSSSSSTTSSSFSTLPSYLESLALPSDLALPTRWSSTDKSAHIALVSPKPPLLHAAYTGQGKKDTDAASIRADKPVPVGCPFFYYEVDILSKGRDGYIGVGWSAEGLNLSRLPGWDKMSWGWHGDDGHLFAGSGTGTTFGPRFTTGDVVGCGLDAVQGCFFFTKNGLMLDRAFRESPFPHQVTLYPFLGFRTPREEAQANFGQKPFRFDIAAYEDRMVEYVLGYLIYHAHAQAVFSFAHQVSLDQEILIHLLRKYGGNGGGEDGGLEGLKADLEARERIRTSLSYGHVDDAMTLTREWYPHVLEGSPGPRVLFSLEARKFIELMRLVYDDEDEEDEDEGKGEKEEEGKDGALDHQAHHTPKTSSKGKASQWKGKSQKVQETQEQRMDRVMEYGQYLQERWGRTQDPEILQALSDTFALVAYKDARKSPVAHLLRKQGRLDVAMELNAAIVGCEEDILGRTIRACGALGEVGRRLRVAPLTLVDLSRSCL
ncbi:MAG: concanavalin A-like lectin/glucanase domain-containing protein [Piptocephalis tieghemiana]|nr:MAG: concanavalin A-like lectin/glucanase domain-containing protein [Piptocephalis tieghemiana]